MTTTKLADLTRPVVDVLAELLSETLDPFCTCPHCETPRKARASAALGRYDREKPADRVRELEAEVARLQSALSDVAAAAVEFLRDIRALGIDCEELRGYEMKLTEFTARAEGATPTTTPPGPTPTQ